MSEPTPERWYPPYCMHCYKRLPDDREDAPSDHAEDCRWIAAKVDDEVQWWAI